MKSQLAHITPQLMQLQEGLSSCGVTTSVQENPYLWENVFSFTKHSQDLTAEELMDQLGANLSTTQIQKENEIDVYKFFCDFLQAIDQGRGGMFLKYLVPVFCTNNSKWVLCHWMQFNICFRPSP